MDPELYLRLGAARLEELRREARVASLASRGAHVAAARRRAPRPRFRRAFGGLLLAAGTRLARE